MSYPLIFFKVGFTMMFHINLNLPCITRGYWLTVTFVGNLKPFASADGSRCHENWPFPKRLGAGVLSEVDPLQFQKQFWYVLILFTQPFVAVLCEEKHHEPESRCFLAFYPKYLICSCSKSLNFRQRYQRMANATSAEQAHEDHLDFSGCYRTVSIYVCDILI